MHMCLKKRWCEAQQAAPLLGQARVLLRVLRLLHGVQELAPQLVPHPRRRLVLLAHFRLQGGFHDLKLSTCVFITIPA